MNRFDLTCDNYIFKVINEENTRFLMKGKTEDVLFDNGMLR